jgi:hypothetical protein
MWSGGVQNEADRARRATKDLESHTYGLRGLQPLEIPQNGQRFVWKSLDKNSLDLEKLAEKLGGGRPHSAAFAAPPIAQGLPGARGWPKSPNLDQEFAFENRKACCTPANASYAWRTMGRTEEGKSP